MRICMISPEFLSGGIGNYVYQLSKKLHEKGHSITVVIRGSIKKTEEEDVNGINVIRVFMPPLYPFHIYIHGIFINTLLKSLENTFDVIHLHSPIVPIINTNLPILITVHTLYTIDTSHHERLNLYSLADRCQSLFLYELEKKTLKSANKINAVSTSVAKELKKYQLIEKPIDILGNGVDENIFYPEKNLNLKNKYILYAGRLGERKGLFDLIDCAAYVIKKYPNIKFFLTGKGPLRNKLVKKVRNMGLQKQILFLGYVPFEYLQRLYRNAYIHIIPSHYEGLPNVLLEAMSSGVPVIATNVGGAPDIISSGVNGFLVSPKDPIEMGKIAIKLLDNVEIRNKIGNSARYTIENNYTWNIIANRVLKYYNEII